MFEVDSGKLRFVLDGHVGRAHATAFHPDGSRLATGGDDGWIRIWNTETGDLTLELLAHETYVYRLAFSPDGTRLVSTSGDSTVRVWDTVPFAD